jgi:hypothetical protein
MTEQRFRDGVQVHAEQVPRAAQAVATAVVTSAAQHRRRSSSTARVAGSASDYLAVFDDFNN